jgi:NAD-dependent deacetylase
MFARPLLAALRSAQHVVALTGAGISAESGLPTFRDRQTGLWANHRPEDLATPEAFARDPTLVWRWYAWRRSLVAAAEPNAGHRALVALAERVPKFTLVTQNVDGLHERAGSGGVLELHGSIVRCRCSECEWRYDAWEERADGTPAVCACGAYLRPDVVWFGEALPEAALRRAADAAGSCDVLLAIGTSGLVYPAASLAPLAHANGAVVTVINPDPAAAPAGTISIAAPAAVALPALIEAAWPAPR